MSPAAAKMAQKLDRIAVKAQRAGLAMGVGAALLGAGIKKTVSAAVELDDNMRKVAARSQDIDASKLNELRNVAKELGRTTSFTTAEVSELMATLAQAGLNGDQIKAQTNNMLSFARANGIATDAAAEFAFAAGLAFGVDKSDSEGIKHVTDVMTYAASASFQSVEDIGEAFKMVAPVANSAGQSIEDVGAALALLANMGIKGSMAGRQMKNVILRMGKEGSEVAKSLGVDVADAKGDLKGLPELLSDFHRITKDMGNVEAMNLFNEAFGKIGLNAAMIGANGVDGIRKLSKEMSELSGFTQRTSDIMDGGIGGSLRRLWSAIDGVVIAIGESMVPVIGALTETLTTVINTVTPVIEAMQSLGIQIVAIFGWLSAGAVSLIALAGIATVLSTLISGVVGFFGFLGTAISVVTGVVGALVSAVAMLGSIGFLPLAGLIAAVVIQFGLLTAAFKVGMKAYKRILELITGSAEHFRQAAANGDWKSVWQLMKATGKLAIAEMTEYMGSSFASVFKGILKAWKRTTGFMKKVGIVGQNVFANAMVDLMQSTGQIDQQTAYDMKEIIQNENLEAFRQATNANQSDLDAIDAFFDGGVAGAKKELEDIKKKIEGQTEEREKKEAEEARKKATAESWFTRRANPFVKLFEAGQKHVEGKIRSGKLAMLGKEVGEVTRKTTLGTTGAFSAASLRSKLAKDSLQIQKDQLTEIKKTNALLKSKKGVWVN